MYSVLFLILSLAATMVHAFCIYNHTPDFEFFIHQEPRHTGGNYLSRFQVNALKPGEKACCSYTNSDCNNDGNKENILLMAIQPTFSQIEQNFITVTMPAGGWLDFNGRGPIPEIKVYNPDGSPHEYTFNTNVQSVLLH